MLLSDWSHLWVPVPWVFLISLLIDLDQEGGELVEIQLARIIIGKMCIFSWVKHTVPATPMQAEEVNYIGPQMAGGGNAWQLRGSLSQPVECVDNLPVL